MQSSPLPCYLVFPRSKYPPQYPIQENPQPTFLPQCERPSFTTIQKLSHTAYDKMFLRRTSACQARIARSVWRLATLLDRGSNAGGGEIYHTRPDRPGAHQAYYTVGTGLFPWVKLPGRGVNHPFSRRS